MTDIERLRGRVAVARVLLADDLAALAARHDLDGLAEALDGLCKAVGSGHVPGPWRELAAALVAVQRFERGDG